jgi:predicted N-acetyltransferase YhbS
MLIRPEVPDDYAAIAEVNRAAFGGPLEAMLVERLRSKGFLTGIAGRVEYPDAFSLFA